MEIVWHMHHCGDSVGEGGSQAGEKKKKRRERQSDGEREDKRGERKDRRGSDVLLKLGQLHFLSLVLTRSSVYPYRMLRGRGGEKNGHEKSAEIFGQCLEAEMQNLIP